MMDIMVRSIARAGGIEVPEDRRVVPAPSPIGGPGLLVHGRAAVSAVLRVAGRALLRAGDRFAAPAAGRSGGEVQQC